MTEGNSMNGARCLTIHVGGTLRDVADSVLADIARFEAGHTVDEDHVTFESWQALFSVLTPKRYELLRHVHRQPAASVRALSRALARDYKRVHEDVQILTRAGLLQHDAGGLRTDYAAIDVPATRIAL
jgi:predicted transcriptional regulator